MIGAFRDITERKLEEQQLKLMESVITYTTDAVIISKVERDVVKIVFVNRLDSIAYCPRTFVKNNGYHKFVRRWVCSANGSGRVPAIH